MAANVDEVQYAAEEGPCLESLRTGQVINVPDLAAESRWGAYRMHALGYGVRSSLSLPLTVEDEVRGALNLYARSAGAFHPMAHEAAGMFSTHVLALLTLAARQARQAELSTQLRETLASRSVIDQAIGIVMGSDTEITMERLDDTLTITVADTTMDWPQRGRAHRPLDEGGRGLSIVDAVSGAAGSYPRPFGKAVWCTLPLRPGAGAPTA